MRPVLVSKLVGRQLGTPARFFCGQLFGSFEAYIVVSDGHRGL